LRRNFDNLRTATDQEEILKPTFWEMREKSAVQRAVCVPTELLTAGPREMRKTWIEFVSWLTFISTIYRNSVPTTQRTQSVSFMKTNQLMLFCEATVIYGDCELYGTSKYTMLATYIFETPHLVYRHKVASVFFIYISKHLSLNPSKFPLPCLQKCCTFNYAHFPFSFLTLRKWYKLNF
jgi:hypothetical protein